MFKTYTMELAGRTLKVEIGRVAAVNPEHPAFFMDMIHRLTPDNLNWQTKKDKDPSENQDVFVLTSVLYDVQAVLSIISCTLGHYLTNGAVYSALISAISFFPSMYG